MTENIFKLSTGALALSITFRNSLAPAGTSCRWMLSVAWVFLALSILCYILFQSQFALIVMTSERHRSELETISKRDELLPSDEAFMKTSLEEVKRHGDLAVKCWKVVMGSFLTGIGFLLLFAVINNS